jgi:hypothetical protein
MAQTYTLEEAADKLDLSVEEFKRRLRTEWSQVRSFRDGATLRFRANEIDELARSIGLGSSEELPMADSGYDLPAPHAPTTKAGDSDAPLKLDDSDETFLITPDEPGKSPSGKKLKSKSDSDVRLEKSSKRPAPTADDEESILTEEFDVGPGGSGKLSGKSGKLSAAKLKGDSAKIKTGDSAKTKTGDSGKQKAAAPKAMEDSSSEFELTLEADSDEFELSLAPDSSEEVALGEAPKEPAAKSGQSGINLNRPADSGVSLEKRKQPAPGSDEEIDFELSLETPGSGASGKKSSSGKLGAKKKLEADSDSEFELTLEEPSDLSLDATGAAAEKKGDIFEATDFEIPALEDDSASEAVALEESDTDLESSDFDLALDEADAVADDESASEVVALDDEEGASKAKKRKRKAADEDEDEGDVDLGDDLDDDEEFAEVAEEEDEERPVVIAAPAKWGALPAVLMAPTVLIMFLGGLMAYETLHTVWGYQQTTKPTTPLISWFADTFGMKPGQ